MDIYIVRTGDNVDEIASSYGADVQRIIFDNQLVPPYRLAVGQALVIRTEEEASVEAPERGMNGGNVIRKKSIVSGGYAYPFISPWVLRQTLPYLTELSIFSYGFTENGNLVPPALDESWMIEMAGEYQVNPILTLTPLGPDGRFNNQLISVMVNDRQVQDRLIWNLGSQMIEKGYKGLNVDFEYILAEDRDAYTAFVGRLTEVMNLFDYRVSVALAPKTSAEQAGVLYEGMDYRGLGEAANEVFLMAYEWGYTYGPPMAVAPLDEVRRVLDYAVTEIPTDKIILGMPNYGYAWPLPFERGVTRARTLGNIEAVQLAITYGVPIQFDEEAKAPYFHYWQYGINHEVWFEDARSVSSSMELIEDYRLRGGGYWHLMQLFRAIWLVMENRFYIVKG